MGGFLLCFWVSLLEWFLAAKRTVAITKSSGFAGLIVMAEVTLGLWAGYVIFVERNIAAAVGCILGAGVGVTLSRWRS